ncbi:unnamed protein product [Paramecium primaurelia]|uniref:Uncharacterized protein n=1 Tax=Paramecium primaurelia TaxID=5886 RepID=A0A8S1P1D3_PARPR|nr:unnamed protein product [Paramecium primaurelia]
MLTTFNSTNLTSSKERHRQISCLLLNYIKTHYKNIFVENQNFNRLSNQKTLNNLQKLKEDYQAKQLALQYFSSFQLIQDILASQIEVDCLADIQKLCLFLSV